MLNIKKNAFNIFYQRGLKNFCLESLNIANKKIDYLNQLFNCKINDLGELKVSIFHIRDDFENYIKSIADGKCPPKWAKGCFYNGEIQIFINKRDEDELKNRQYTLLHELVHLYIKKMIYQKYNLRRMTWFDESFATYLAKCDVKLINEYKNNSKELDRYKDFDVNLFEDKKFLNSKDYNSYHMFSVIGKYIFDNNLEKKYLNLIVNDYDEIRKFGRTILNDALKYINNLKEDL